MKRLLIVANVSKEHIRKFHIPFILMMKEKGWQVDVACRLDAPIPECDNAYNLPCDRSPFKTNFFASINIVRCLIANNHYDVVHCHTITGSMIARLSMRSLSGNKPKVFYTNHGIHFFKGASVRRWLMGYPMEKILSHDTDIFIAINKEDYETAKKYLMKHKTVERIHGIGVDLSRFRNTYTKFDRNTYREKLGLTPQDYVIIYVAELNKNKNQRQLLKAFKLVQLKIPSSRLLLVGPDHYNGKLQDLAVKEGIDKQVMFLGWRNDIPQLLCSSDVYAATSKSEGLGLNIIEAMACNLPVVAFKNRGHCEIIQNGINGFLVNSGDCSELAKIICFFYHDSQEKYKMITQAQQDVNKYEIDAVLKELAYIYDKYS